MKQTELIRIAVYTAIIIAAALLVYSVYTTFFENSKVPNTPADYEKALASENKEDICATPSDYTDEEWREHMSHHKEQYRQCFGK